MDSMKKSIADMHQLFHTRMADFESQLTNDSNHTQNNSSLATEFSSFRTFVVGMLDNLQKQIESLSDTVDVMEMRSRRKMLLFHGIPECPNENTSEVITNVITESLKVSNFSIHNIKRCQRLGRHTSQKPRPVLVKLQDYNDIMHDKLWFSKIKLKGTGITISEFLTKSRHDVFMSVRERFGINNCWTREGNIYVQGPDGTRHCINTLSYLMDLQTKLADVNAKPVAVSKTTAVKQRRAASSKK